MRDIPSWDSQLAYLWDILNGEIQSKPSGSNFLNCHTSNSANRKRLKPTDSVWVIQKFNRKISTHNENTYTLCENRTSANNRTDSANSESLDSGWILKVLNLKIESKQI